MNMNLSILNILLYFFFFTENLCQRKGTTLTQSSTYQDRYAQFAHDGQLGTTYSFCAITDLNYSKAWLQVDLFKSYSIKNVRIYHRNEGEI